MTTPILRLAYVQFNVSNLFDEFYHGAFDSVGTDKYSTSYTYIGAPRTVSASINFAF